VAEQATGCGKRAVGVFQHMDIGAEGLGSGLVLHAEPVLAALGGHDLASRMPMEHGALAVHVMLK